MSVATAAPSERIASEYLESLAQRVRMWRLREGKSYFSMPTPLWDEAIAAARKVGLRHASRVLGLSRDALKRRMGLADAVKDLATIPVAEESAEADFIELPGAAAMLAMPKAVEPASEVPADHDIEGFTVASAGEAVVQVTATDGAKLTVRLPVAHLNIVSLVHQFRTRA